MKLIHADRFLILLYHFYKIGEEGQLCGIALLKRKKLLKVSLNMVVMSNNHILSWFKFDANRSCYLTKRDLTFKLAHLVSFCFVSSVQSRKVLTINSFFSAYYWLYLEIAIFYTKPSAQLVWCHVTNVKCFNLFR